MTIWRAVIGFKGRYEISDDGQVKALAAPGRGRLNEDRVLKLSKNPAGYTQVILYYGRRRCISKRVHNLVLEMFVGPRPLGMFGLHRDDDRTNNIVSNLYWGTRSQNTLDSVANGNHNHARKTHCKAGHPFSVSNGKQRICRTCANRRNAEYRARRRRALAVYTADTLERAEAV